MSDSLAFFLQALVALITVVDPIGLVPVALTLTAGQAPPARRRVITRAIVIAAGILAFFAVAGRRLLAVLGVSPMAFGIAGGALLFLVAIDMLFGRPSGARETNREVREAQQRDDVSVFPLAIPLIAGPGTVTTLILLVDAADGRNTRWAALAVAVGTTLAAAWITMRLGLRIQRHLGTTGGLVLSRVLGLLLAAVAVQFILNGLGEFLGMVNR